MMEQKTVTGFFPVVKNNNSSFAIHPAKRRKVMRSKFFYDMNKNKSIFELKVCTSKNQKATHKTLGSQCTEYRTCLRDPKRYKHCRQGQLAC